MTSSLVFQIKDKDLLDTVKVGDKIHFTASQVNGDYTVRPTEVRKQGKPLLAFFMIPTPNALLRYLLLALLILMLPARGWASQVMSLQQVPMPVQQVSAWAAAEADVAANEADLIVDAADAMPEDCPMHKAAASDAPPLCSGCDDCQLCLTVAAPAPVPSQGLGLSLAPVMPAKARRFSSADGLGWLKPPIP